MTVEKTWTMRLTKTKETDRRDASGEMAEARYLATFESDDAALVVSQLDGRELRDLRYGETYEVALRRKRATGDEEPPAAPRPVREMTWVEDMFPSYAEPEEVAP